MIKDKKTSMQKSSELKILSLEPGQHPFVQQIIAIQANEAEAFSAYASGNLDEAVNKMTEAVEIENSIDSLSQPPYPIIPANELFGLLLTEMKKPENFQGLQDYADSPKTTDIVFAAKTR